MADELKATPVKREWALKLADALRSGREYANKLELPFFGGAGDFVLGKTPEGLERVAYDEPLTSGSGWTTRLRPETVDMGFTALDVLPVGKVLAKGLRKGTEAASTAAVRGITGNPNATPIGVIDEIQRMNLLPAVAKKSMPEAPNAQALREAEEYGQKMLGLPPGNTPMDRAIAGGFDPMYHGTASVIDEIDPRKYGGATRAQSAKEAFWGSGTVPTSEGYANYAAKEVPVRDLISQADEAGNVGDWDKADELIRQAEDLERDIYNQPLRGQNIMPMMVNTKNAKVVDLGGAEYTDVEGGINQYLKQGKREGKDVVVLENLSDDPGRSNMATTHYAVLNPGAVRSQFAAFDPRYFGKPGLMLGVGGIGVKGLYGNDEEYQ